MYNNRITQFYLPPAFTPQPQASPPSGWYQYSLHLPMKGWPGWVDLSGWSHTETNVPHTPQVTSEQIFPSNHLTGTETQSFLIPKSTPSTISRKFTDSF